MISVNSVKVLSAHVISLLVGLSAGASPVDGETMICEFQLQKIELSTHKTVYQFLGDKTGSGIEEVLVTRPGYTGGQVIDFKLDGSSLGLADGVGGYNIYDISNPASISRAFSYCVFPGQGGGGSTSVCESTIERCILK